MLDVVSFLHHWFGLALLLFAVALGLLGTWQLWRHQTVSPGFRASFLIMIGLVAVQGLAGIVAYLTGGHPKETLHIVYGIFAIVFLPAVIGWATRGSRLREAAILAGACWIVAIAFGRGILTGA